MPAKIKFGTSGWRAIIADEFTFANVRLATEAIGRFVRRQNPHPSILVGFDTRFAAEDFGREAARVLASQGIRVLLSAGSVPTPAVSASVIQRKLDGAINMTASHNPGEYNGLKFSTADGAPALPGVTHAIEAEIEGLQAAHWELSGAHDPSLIETVDIREEYLRDLSTKVDLEKIRSANLSIGYDALHGAGAGYLDEILRRSGLTVHTLHTNRDVYFGGHHPEPADENLDALKLAMADHSLKLGLSTDGDADRFGVVDEGGHHVSANDLLGLLVDYLFETRGWRGAVARSVATTHLIDRVAAHHGLDLLETPVGFKYIGEYIKEGRIFLGGEESAGLSIRGHIPEKDGILACLLAAEMVASRRKSLTEQRKTLFSTVGPVYNRRRNLKLDPGFSAKVRQKIESEIREFYGRPVVQQNRLDGLKLIFEDGSWVLMRPSGTEPVVRFYAEAGSLEQLEALVNSGKQWIAEN